MEKHIFKQKNLITLVGNILWHGMMYLCAKYGDIILKYLWGFPPRLFGFKTIKVIKIKFIIFLSTCTHKMTPCQRIVFLTFFKQVKIVGTSRTKDLISTLCGYCTDFTWVY